MSESFLYFISTGIIIFRVIYSNEPFLTTLEGNKHLKTYYAGTLRSLETYNAQQKLTVIALSNHSSVDFQKTCSLSLDNSTDEEQCTFYNLISDQGNLAGETLSHPLISSPSINSENIIKSFNSSARQFR